MREEHSTLLFIYQLFISQLRDDDHGGMVDQIFVLLLLALYVGHGYREEWSALCRFQQELR